MAHPSRPKNISRRKFSRLRKLGDNLKQFCTAQGARLAASATARTVTAVASTDVLTSTAHGFVTGKGPVNFFNSGGALPAGLTATGLFWPIRIDADTFYIALNRKNAARNIRIDITTNGTGTTTAKYSTTAAGIFSRIKNMGLNWRSVVACTDIDNL